MLLIPGPRDTTTVNATVTVRIGTEAVGIDETAPGIDFVIVTIDIG